MDFKLILIFVLASEATAVTINDCPANLPRDRYLRAFGKSCYHFIISHERDFTTAERECEARKGHLVIIRDPATQSFLYNTLRNDFHYSGIVWIGLSDQVNEDRWVWVDGSRATYTHWASGQPGIVGILEDCAALDVDDGGRWHDYQCEGILFLSEEHYFVCEYPIVKHTTPTTTTTTMKPTTTPESTTTPEPTTPQPTTTPEPTTPQPTTTPEPTTPQSMTTAKPTTPQPTTPEPTKPQPTTTPPKPEPTTVPTTTIPTSRPTTTPKLTTTPLPSTTSEAMTTPKPTTTPQPTTTAKPSTTPQPTTTPTDATTGCPPLHCALDCGLTGYEINDQGCMICQCAA